MGNEIYKKIKGGLIVSCQALEGEPLYKETGNVMNLMALAAVEGGACAIRAQGLIDIKQIKETVDVPIIGIYKKKYEGFESYITPTMNEVDELVLLGCDIIAVDATKQKRGDSISSFQYIREIKEKYPTQLIMADCADLQDAIQADKAGADFIGTTLSGYTGYSKNIKKPNIDLIKQIKNNTSKPIIAEGGFTNYEEVNKALSNGAYSVVIGTAITRPREITRNIVKNIIRIK